ncbi:DUF4440 domain-containing protein [Nocardioides sp. SYSU D00065]|uniref:DUF4440 domain-containing protein n=1 Tax=Nocardioides sp. SYSU D00065 TaxID=2817378 RepID=UPI001B329C1D|nr:DUF4440 domain-containing protein [Nocardioides sp. SYSU D00065]
MTTSTTQLPAPVRTFLDAHAARDTERAARTFAATAEVVDDGRTFRGTAEVLDFLRGAGAEYTYTTELIDAQRVDDAHWVAVNRLEGDFPGGVVELRYRFTLVDGLIAELVIAP